MVKAGVAFSKHPLANSRPNYYTKMKKKPLIPKLDLLHFVVTKVDRVVF